MLPVATVVRLSVSPKGRGCAELVGMVTRTRHSNRNLDTSRRQTDAGDNTHTLNEILPQDNRQKDNSDEREVVQTTYPQRVAARLIPTKENMRHCASLEKDTRRDASLDTYTHCTHAHTNHSCATVGFISRPNETNTPTRHTGRSTAQALYTRAVRRDTVRFISGRNNTTQTKPVL